MKYSLFIYSVIFFLTISCKKSVDNNVDFDQKSNYETIDEITISKPKYIFVVFTVEEPNLLAVKEIDTERSNYDLVYKDSWNVEIKKVVYKSSIQEITNYNEDTKYKILDDFEVDLNQEISDKDWNFQTNLRIKCKDLELREILKKNQCKIIDRQAFVFDSYSEASISRQKY